MKKAEFLKSLKKALRGLKPEERKKYLSDYEETIADRMESGESEEQAVAELGDVAAIAQGILADAAENGQLKPKLSAGNKVLLIVGSPLWLALSLAVLAVAIALAAAALAVIVSLYAVELALAAAFLGGIVSALCAVGTSPLSAAFIFGCALVCGGACVLLFFPLTKFAKFLLRKTVEGAKYIKSKISERLG